LASERHVVLIAAEVTDILLHPAERCLLVEDAVVGEGVALGIYRRMRHESKQTQAVVDGDYDKVASCGKVGAVIGVACAVEVSSSVDPDEDRKQLVRRRMNVRAVDVEIQAVFVGVRRTCKRAKGGYLQADVPELRCVPHTSPRYRWLRRFPAKIADRRGGIRNSPELRHAVLDEALNGAIASIDESIARWVRLRPGST
jgi:hypothetical protein